jgi:hypothetical protein
MNRNFDVVVWFKPQSDLRNQLIARAGRAPDDGCESARAADLHWHFDDAADAVKCAESFFEFAALDSVTYLVVTPYGDETFERKIYKDTRAKMA